MAACDIYRPAAVQQLQVLGRQIDIPVYTEEPGAKAADHCEKCREERAQKLK